MKLLLYVIVGIVALIISIKECKESCGEIEMVDKKTLDAFGEFYKVANGEYTPVCKTQDMTVSFTKESDITTPVGVNEPITFTLEGTCTGVFNNELVFDLFHPVRCNCRNCGAPVRLNYCEYCGTQYPQDMHFKMKVGDKNE